MDFDRSATRWRDPIADHDPQDVWLLPEQGRRGSGFASDSAPVPPSPDDLVAQFRNALARRPDGEFMVKIFTSGSFLDASEVPLEVRSTILEELESDSDVSKA